MRSVVEGAVRRRRQPRNQPESQKNWDERPPQGDNSEINYAQRHVQHVHAREPKEGSRKLRHGLCHVAELRTGGVMRHSREYWQSQPFCDQIAPFPSVEDYEGRPAGHRGKQPPALGFGIPEYRGSHRQHHGQRTGEQKCRHQRGVADAFRVKRCRPVRR